MNRKPRVFLLPCLLVLLFLGCGAPSPDSADSRNGSDATGSDPDRPDSGQVHADQWPKLDSPLAPDPQLEARLETLMAAMTLEEKVGQVIQGEIRHVTPDDLRQYHLGSVLNGGGSHPRGDRNATVGDWLSLADEFWQASTDTSDGGVGIPALWGVDAVHGHTNVIGATIFPHNIGLGAAGDVDLVRRIGEVTAREVRATGLDWNFGPTLAVVRDDRWGRTYEGYSEDPELVARLGRAMVLGLQGEVGSDVFLGPDRVISTAKHFLGDGGTLGGKDQGDNRAAESELRDVHGAGYVSALEAGAQTVMASFSSWHGRKMHGHHELLTDVLRDQMGFDGFVVGDWNGHGQVEGCSNDSCAASLLAGVDMFMVPEDWKALYANTLAQVRDGTIPVARLDEAVRRIVRVKLRSGLFEAGKPSSRPGAGEDALVGSPEHRAVAREAVRKSLVLLLNRGGLLPLDPSSTVLVAGDGADDIGKQSGGWTITWQGTGNTADDFPGGTSIWAGIRQAVQAAGGTAVFSADGSFGPGSPAGGATATRPDVAIVVFGEDPYAEFQGDVQSVDFTGQGLELLQELKEAGIPTVSVFLSGRALWVNPELNASDAFVAAWLPGSEGVGVADVLFRAADGSIPHDFTGRLSYSWPRDPSQAQVNVGDQGYDPLWPVGYGYSYGQEAELEALSEETLQNGPAESREVYFDGGPVGQWQLYVGNESDPKVPGHGAIATTKGGPGGLEMRTSDRRVQEDARDVEWQNRGPARVYLEASESIDLDRESNGGLALSVDLSVATPPNSAVHLALGCGGEDGEDCRGSLDITSWLEAAAASGSEEAWQTLRIRLRCFAEAGADMGRVAMPFSLETAGSLDLQFSDIRLVSAANGDAPCPAP